MVWWMPAAGCSDEGLVRGLTESSLNAFLTWLDADRDRAAESYERIRRRLILFFETRGFGNSDELADATIDRVVGRIAGGAEIPAQARDSFFYKTASFIAMESARIPRSDPLTADPPVGADRGDAGSRRECMSTCLNECLQRLTGEQGSKLLRFYVGQGEEKINNRKKMAEELGIPASALWSRMYRLRAKVEECVRACVQRSGESI
jgi:hypothetical protein